MPPHCLPAPVCRAIYALFCAGRSSSPPRAHAPIPQYSTAGVDIFLNRDFLPPAVSMWAPVHGAPASDSTHGKAAAGGGRLPTRVGKEFVQGGSGPPAHKEISLCSGCFLLPWLRRSGPCRESCNPARKMRTLRPLLTVPCIIVVASSTASFVMRLWLNTAKAAFWNVAGIAPAGLAQPDCAPTLRSIHPSAASSCWVSPVGSPRFRSQTPSRHARAPGILVRPIPSVGGCPRAVLSWQTQPAQNFSPAHLFPRMVAEARAHRHPREKKGLGSASCSGVPHMIPYVSWQVWPKQKPCP